MEFSKSFLLVLLVLAGLAFLFQLIGFFGPGWLVYELRYNLNFMPFQGHGSQYIGNNPGYGGAYGTGGTGGTYGTGGVYGTYGQGGYNQGGYGGGYPQGGYGGNTYGGYGGGYGANSGSYGGPQSNLPGAAIVVKLQQGLWAFHGCVEYTTSNREDCQLTYTKIRYALGIASSTGERSSRSETEVMFGSATAQKVLATLGLLMAVAGLIFNILLFTHIIDSSKCKRIFCVIAWIFSGLMVFSAIVAQAKDIADMHYGFENMEATIGPMYKLKTFAPWSLIISGFGAFFGILNAVLVAAILPRCVGDSDQGSYEVDNKSDRGSYRSSYLEAPMKPMQEYT